MSENEFEKAYNDQHVKGEPYKGTNQAQYSINPELLAKAQADATAARASLLELRKTTSDVRSDAAVYESNTAVMSQALDLADKFLAMLPGLLQSHPGGPVEAVKDPGILGQINSVAGLVGQAKQIGGLLGLFPVV